MSRMPRRRSTRPTQHACIARMLDAKMLQAQLAAWNQFAVFQSQPKSRPAPSACKYLFRIGMQACPMQLHRCHRQVPQHRQFPVSDRCKHFRRRRRLPFDSRHSLHRRRIRGHRIPIATRRAPPIAPPQSPHLARNFNANCIRNSKTKRFPNFEVQEEYWYPWALQHLESDSAWRLHRTDCRHRTQHLPVPGGLDLQEQAQ